MTNLPPEWFRDDDRPSSGGRSVPIPGGAGGGRRPDDTDPQLDPNGRTQALGVSPSYGSPQTGANDGTAVMPQVGRPGGPPPQGFRGPPPGFGGSPGASTPPERGPQPSPWDAPRQSPGGLSGPPGPPPRRGGGGRGPGIPRVRPVRWMRRIILAIVVLLVSVLTFYIGLGYWATSRIERVDALTDYSGRPSNSLGSNWLIVGSDSREGLTAAQRRRLRTGKAEGRRTDTILLLHIPPIGDPTLMSLPRDSLVEIPRHRRNGREVSARTNKLNAAYSIGGPDLLVRTVEQSTGLHIDHYAEVGFAGVANTTDAVGGVRLCPKRPMDDRRAGIKLKAGCQVLKGPQALGYVRARYSDPRGDLGRVERQQEFVGALMSEVATFGTLINPIRLVAVSRAGTDALRLDPDSGMFDLLRAGWAMKSVTGGEGRAITVPIANPDYNDRNAGSSVLWDKRQAEIAFRKMGASQSPILPG